MSEPEASPYPISSAATGEREGLISMKYIKSLSGLCNIAVIVSLLLGFICCVTLSVNAANRVDACNATNVKVDVKSSMISYALFSIVGLLAFLLLFLINSINVPFLKSLKDLLSAMMSIGIIAFFAVLIFILSATQAASEKKLGRARKYCHANVRPGGPGASCFFGLVAVIAMVAMAAFIFMKK